MMRTVLSIMAGLLCALAGLRHAMSIKGEGARMQRWVQMLSHLALLLEEGTMSLPEAICRAAMGGSQVDQVMRDTASAVKDSPLTSLAVAFRARCGDWPERDMLCRMMERISRGTKENRVLAISQAQQEMELMAREAAGKAGKDAKLWATLGIVGGVCATIFLI